MNINDKPLYTLYFVGYPSDDVLYYSQAAELLGINLTVKFHGCIVKTVYTYDFGLKITDADIKKLELEEANKIAGKYYVEHFGDNWLELVKKKAGELYRYNPYYDPNLPF